MPDQDQDSNSDDSEPSTETNRPSGITSAEWALIRQHREAELPTVAASDVTDPVSDDQSGTPEIALPAPTAGLTKRPASLKPGMSRGKRLSMWALGGLLAGSTITVPAIVALNGDGNTEPKQEPGVSGPEVPGAATGGFELSGDQIDAMNSGDPEKIMEVMDVTLIPEIQTYLNEKLNGDNPSDDAISSDKTISSALDNLVDDIDRATAGDTMRDIYILPATAFKSTDDVGDKFKNRPSTFEPGKPLRIQGTVTALEINTDGIDIDTEFPGITVNFTGSSVELADIE